MHTSGVRPFHTLRNVETLRAQVYGDNTMVVNEGKVDYLWARLPRPLFCSRP